MSSTGNDVALRARLDDVLKSTATGDLRASAIELLATLGYASNKTLDWPTQPQAFASEVETLLGGTQRLNAEAACLADWSSVSFLFQLTNDELPTLAAGQMSFFSNIGVQPYQIESFIFLAVDLKPGNWSRTRLARITRELNRLFPMSALGLAIYLAGRLALVQQATGDAPKLLVLDDVLIGIDHSNRLPVLDVLNKYFADWQVILLTHDRTWFDLARERLPKNDWACCEVYEGDSAATAPMPIVRPTMNKPARALLQKANDLLKLGYVEAAANYARQALELGMRKACELKKISMIYRQDPTVHQAQDLLNALKGWPGSASVPKIDWDAAIHRLELLKNVVMNPYSHPSAPNIPKQEVTDAIAAVAAFLDLVAKK